MATVLITGANRGIGLEFVREYAADGWRVIAACRKPKKAKDVEQVNGDVTLRALDVADPDSVATFVDETKNEPIDVLINNAGVYLDRNIPFGKLDYAGWMTSFQVNTVGPVRVAEALADAVAASSRKLMVFVSTQMASIAENSAGGAYAYRASKAALNAAVKSMAVDIKARGIACLLLHPGWVRTDMGGKNATLDVRDSVHGMRRVIEDFDLARTGSFLRYNGEPVPW
jgi:NAD(P)-dependent dehydrogenase (short-subunit alcohol dehydrogenase family)